MTTYETGVSLEEIRLGARAEYDAVMAYTERLERMPNNPSSEDVRSILPLLRDRRAASRAQFQRMDRAITDLETLLRAMQQSTLADHQATRRADAVAARFSRRMRKKTHREIAATVCGEPGCGRSAHFMGPNGNWCKRHVPDADRPRGKVA